MVGDRNNVSRRYIQGLPHPHDFFELCPSLAVLKQWPITVALSAGNKRIDWGLQINHDPATFQRISIHLRENGSATCRHNYIVALGQLIDNCRLAAPESFFALDFENERNTGARPPLDFMIGIDEFLMQQLGQMAPNRGFAGTHGANKKNPANVTHGMGMPVCWPEIKRAAGAALLLD